MKTLTGIVFAAILALNASVAFAETFDAVKNYTCDQGSAGVWYYEAYKAEVGTYREMDFGHAPVREVSKYGVDAHYVVDGDQPLYPFIMSTPEYLLGSPATEGRRHDAVLAWAAPQGAEVVVTGYVRLLGNIRGDLTGRVVKADLLLNEKVLWSGEVHSGEKKDFEVGADVAAGDRVRLRIQNAGDKSGDLAAFNMHVETGKK